MGIEYPYLALMASMGIIMIVLSVLLFYVYVYTEINRIPVLSGSVEAYVILNNARVQVKVAHERGEPVILQVVMIQTEQGIVECYPNGKCSVETARVNLLGFGERGELLTGGTGYVVVDLDQQSRIYFLENKQYGVVLRFDKGVLRLAFSLLYVIR